MKKWEFKYITLPLDTNTKDRSKGAMSLTIAYNEFGEGYKKAWDEIFKLAGEGWEPISAVAPTRSFMTINGSMRGGAGSSLTDKIIVMLKRPIE
jgi:hypothetical protein